MKFINFIMYLIVIFLFNTSLITIMRMFATLENLSLIILCTIIDCMSISIVESLIKNKLIRNKI
jgi:hypothetical protein